MALLFDVGGPLVYSISLVWAGLLLVKLHRPRAYFYIGFWIIALTVNSWWEDSYVASLLASVGIFVLALIPMLSMQRHERRNQEEHLLRWHRQRPWPFRLYLFGLALLLVQDGVKGASAVDWTVALIAIAPLAASWLLLLRDARKVGMWWAAGLAFPVTALAVALVFVLQRPSDRWPALRRFLAWFVTTFGIGFIVLSLSVSDPLIPLGLVLTFIGISMTAGALCWLGAMAAAAIQTRFFTSRGRDTPTPYPNARRGVGLVATGTVVFAVGVLAFGDFLVDRHPMAQDRSWSQVVRGCAWSDSVDSLLRADATRPVTERLTRFQFVPVVAARSQTNPDLGVATALAQMAVLVYATPATMREVAKGWGFTPDRFAVLGTDRDQALLLANDADMLIAFRGTDQVADWTSNLNFVPTKWLNPEWIARGFRGALARLWPAIAAELERRRGTNPRIWLTGHSLGGALAVLAAQELLAVEPKVNVAALYTFGQPRVVSSGLGASLDQRLAYYRIVLHTDLVPDTGAMETHHSGRQVYFDSFGQVHDAPDTMIRLRDSWCTGLGVTEAHGMRSYLGMIELRRRLQQR